MLICLELISEVNIIEKVEEVKKGEFQVSFLFSFFFVSIHCARSTPSTSSSTFPYQVTCTCSKNRSDLL